MIRKTGCVVRWPPVDEAIAPSSSRPLAHLRARAISGWRSARLIEGFGRRSAAMQRANALFDVIDRVYAAAVDPAEWEGALEAITDLFVAEHTTLVALQDAPPILVLADR